MWKKNRWMRPERVMALGFLALIVLGGVLPRKTFSMGHAEEKRYYIECRRIKE